MSAFEKSALYLHARSFFVGYLREWEERMEVGFSGNDQARLGARLIDGAGRGLIVGSVRTDIMGCEQTFIEGSIEHARWNQLRIPSLGPCDRAQNL
jgi:hypothetical protein